MLMLMPVIPPTFFDNLLFPHPLKPDATRPPAQAAPLPSAQAALPRAEPMARPMVKTFPLYDNPGHIHHSLVSTGEKLGPEAKYRPMYGVFSDSTSLYASFDGIVEVRNSLDDKPEICVINVVGKNQRLCSYYSESKYQPGFGTHVENAHILAKYGIICVDKTQSESIVRVVGRPVEGMVRAGQMLRSTVNGRPGQGTHIVGSAICASVHGFVEEVPPDSDDRRPSITVTNRVHPGQLLDITWDYYSGPGTYVYHRHIYASQAGAFDFQYQDSVRDSPLIALRHQTSPRCG
jgi:exosome complex RNA-binding protein Rrp4